MSFELAAVPPTVTLDVERQLGMDKGWACDRYEYVRHGEGRNKVICPAYLSPAGCPLGNHCPNPHSKVNDVVVCKYWLLSGTCKGGDRCEFIHEYDLSLMPECLFFVGAGVCHNDDCVYLHTDPSIISGDCPFYARGFCTLGARCRNRHVRTKKMCAWYLAGFCPFGPNCEHAHPRWDQTEGPLVCHKCGKPGHKISQCTQPVYIPNFGTRKGIAAQHDTARGGPKSFAHITCRACGEQGHYQSHCPTRGGGPSMAPGLAMGGPPRPRVPYNQFQGNSFQHSAPPAAAAAAAAAPSAPAAAAPPMSHPPTQVNLTPVAPFINPQRLQQLQKPN
jgi:cleavage and polyadenylation specificity factor subunit 4